MVEIANSAVVRRALLKDRIGARPQAGAASLDRETLAPLSDITASQWRRLAEHIIHRCATDRR